MQQSYLMLNIYLPTDPSLNLAPAVSWILLGTESRISKVQVVSEIRIAAYEFSLISLERLVHGKSANDLRILFKIPNLMTYLPEWLGVLLSLLWRG